MCRTPITHTIHTTQTINGSQNNVIFPHDRTSIAQKYTIYCHYNKTRKYFKYAKLIN